ncbi:MAG: hypothetical protein Q7R39_00915 [Dehalococcoidia bacterium]|nr:hypothetical protein [Dehalococcoidia bacterium]
MTRWGWRPKPIERAAPVIAASPDRLESFCSRVLDTEGRPCSDDPRCLARLFRDFFGLEGTPRLSRALDLMSSLGVSLEEVQYLETGAVNMYKDGWHVHFAFKDPPGTQKFDLLHEAYEIVDKTFAALIPSYQGIKEPLLSRNADRFAAAVLMPRDFICRKMAESGCDPVLLGEELELSHQALLIAFAECLPDTPFGAALWDRNPDAADSSLVPEDFQAALVVRSTPARYARRLCLSQRVQAKGSGVATGSLACLAVKSGLAVLCHPEDSEGAAAVLVRPIPWRGHGLGRVLLLALPAEEYHLLQPQVESLNPAPLLVPSWATPACRFEDGFRDCSHCRRDEDRMEKMNADMEDDFNDI